MTERTVTIIFLLSFLSWVDCIWSSWSEWQCLGSQCGNKSEPKMYARRTRNKTIEEKHHGKCDGNYSETISCQQYCDGKFAWSIYLCRICEKAKSYLSYLHFQIKKLFFQITKKMGQNTKQFAKTIQIQILYIIVITLSQMTPLAKEY